MNPFLMAPKPRLNDWKNLRTSLQGQEEAQQLQTVALYWSKPPLATMAYDPELLHTYPTPWEMMVENDWCRNSVAIGMEFTLRLAGWSPERLVIHNMKDFDLPDQKLVLEVDGKHLLNYDYASVVEMPKTRHLFLESWQFTGKFYSKMGH